MQTPKNIKDLMNNYIWCTAGKAEGKWLHHLACRHRQSKSDNNCPTACEWYKALYKLTDDEKRKKSTMIDYLEQKEIVDVKKDLADTKTREKKYTASIPKEKDSANLHEQTQDTGRNMQTRSRRKTRTTKK